MTSLPPAAPYWSFLICSHVSGQLVNVYLNGLPIGVIRDGAFEAHRLAPDQRATTMRDLADSCPFQTLEDLKAAVAGIVAAFTVAPAVPA